MSAILDVNDNTYTKAETNIVCKYLKMALSDAEPS